MQTKEKKVKVTKVVASCSNCGAEKFIYFLPDYSYGERIVTNVDGKQCAYVSLLEEKTSSELEDICKIIFNHHDIIMSRVKMAKCLIAIYGITCDKLNGEYITTVQTWDCYNCSVGKLEENKKHVEQEIELLIPYVSHLTWNELNSVVREHMVEDELLKQGYLL